jgi:outer membrane lipoprotein SlyB
MLQAQSLMSRNGGNLTMKILTKLATGAALAFTAASSLTVPAAAATHHRHHYYGRTAYRHRVCRRSSATTGTVVGGVAGAVVGHGLLGHGLLGTAAGAVGGAVAGGAVDRSMTARHRCYYTR